VAKWHARTIANKLGHPVSVVGFAELEADKTQERRSSRKAEYHDRHRIKVDHQVVTPTTMICKDSNL